jgi:hypothetical protein
MVNQTIWGCDRGETDDDQNCAIGVLGGSGFWEGGMNRYLPCTKLEPPAPYYDATCLTNYGLASLDDVMIANQWFSPPTFIVNGGEPTPASPLRSSRRSERPSPSTRTSGHTFTSSVQ